ncbi:HGxxPAAW family protein [Brachybacterium sp.]|uniref:HGxxPAAW family protein n=1 Tax=Brachybacterium sp. TaxID=1891286 RepID=UPI002ED53FA8
MPKSYAVPPPPHHNEGKTVAAWTMNLGIVLGSLGIGVGMVWSEQLSILIWVGAGVILLAVLVGLVLSKAGLGQPRGYGLSQAARTADGSSGANARSGRPAEADAR